MTQLKKVRFTLRVPNEIFEKIDKESKNLGLSKNAFVLTIINKELNKPI